MTTTYIVTNAFADAVEEIKNPWLIVNEDYVVGAYEGRTAARAAKANGLAGKTVSLKEIILKIADVVEETPVEETPVEEIVVEEIVVEEISQVVEEVAPIVDHLLSSNKRRQVSQVVEEVAPIVENANDHFAEVTEAEHAAHRAEMAHKSTATRPCRLVWDLADSMPAARRKDVIAAAEAKGVAFYTARTQYQLWAQVQKEMAARRAAVQK